MDVDQRLDIRSSSSSSSRSSGSSATSDNDSDIEFTVDQDDASKRSAALDPLAWAPVLVAVVAIPTDVITVLWGCQHPHIDCNIGYPTLGVAARHRPQLYVYLVGTVVASVLFLATAALFAWFLHLSLPPTHRWLAISVLLGGALTAILLVVAAIHDTRGHPAGLSLASATSFLTTWVTLLRMQHARRTAFLLLRTKDATERHHRIRGIAIGEYAIVLGAIASVAYVVTALVTSSSAWWTKLLGPAAYEGLVVASWSALVASFATEIGRLSRLVEQHDLEALSRQK
ncbi:hypothetical protein SPRG_02457 [Saprolegnia parasitica CBS 223.65]|uniref:Uncharacterized protein n=1 Tax=Saprolegnia parasitica (strain CBS 223.65) TaxID=695850 RepID=A0A067CQ08_SAPPC|nr:hypothetical protein SPRG_02457 [Saprolegnia parasitica CBS 223.65]KDO32759.1 hypothetical protein SPRG_02457 [Saprolegnia parasitica CBS 223.65]|eukprot:XP_012196423.1 hypothetical protein SPRG_02457 [Saprolegnia parasitica CBS 223.65]